ncbi:MAG: SprB repeat-containing protein, partial [Bacteroidia bacterium]
MKQLLHRLKSFLCLLFLLLMNVESQASHIYGSKMWNEHLTGCNYRIYLTLYYDCIGCLPAGTQPSIGSHPYFQYQPLWVSGGAGYPTLNSITINSLPSGCGLPIIPANLTLLSYYDMIPVCPTSSTSCLTGSGGIPDGALATTYYMDVDICGLTCQEITFTWSDCCRSNSIVSIINSGSTGFYNSTTINLNYPTNHSVVIPDEIPRYVADDAPSSFSLGAYDVDGDSLSYSLVPARTNTGASVFYSLAFSATQPMGPNWSVYIHPVLGKLSITPTPGGAIGGTSIITIAVAEWRNGVHINTVYSELEVSQFPTPTFNNIPSISYSSQITNGTQVNDSTFIVYPNQNFSFATLANDNDLTQSLVMWCDNANVSLSPSGTNPLTVNVGFAPTLADTGTHYFHLKALDNWCPIRGHSNRLYKIIVPSCLLTDTIIHASCGMANGSIDISHTGLTPPISYSWSNGSVTQDLMNVVAGTYQVTVTDALGHLITQTYYISNSNMQGNILNGPISCFGTTGVMTASASGGASPYMYSWNTGATSNVLTNTVANGIYGVWVTDAVGCLLHLVSQQTKEDSCYNLIKGTAYHDVNGNCQQDAGEVGLMNQQVHLSNNWSFFTDANGKYEFLQTNIGTQYVSYVSNLVYHGIDCPTGYTDTVTFAQNWGGVADSNDFPIRIYAAKDLSVAVFAGNYVPGFPYQAAIYYKNQGTLPVNNVLVTYQYSNVLTSLNFSPVPSTVNGVTQTLSWNVGTLQAGATGLLHVGGITNVSAVIGTPANSTAVIYPILGDTLPSNNTALINQLVVGSFDPNDKMVSPRGVGNAGNITHNDSILTYTIRFQNTGNYPATFVILRDTLDMDLNLNTIQLIGMSHECVTTIENGNVLVFTFNNINLADSASNEPESHGHVLYAIRLKKNLPLGTEIRNKAAIYFDYNAPIITNEVLNTLYQPISIEDENFAKSVSLVPNPTTNESMLSFSNENGELYALIISDLAGRKIASLQSNQTSMLLDATHFPK